MSRPSSDSVLSLEETARQAWACLYSSSDEYDAALIAERRAAGVYGPKRQRRHVMTVAGVVAGLAVIAAAVFAIA